MVIKLLRCRMSFKLWSEVSRVWLQPWSVRGGSFMGSNTILRYEICNLALVVKFNSLRLQYCSLYLYIIKNVVRIVSL